MDLVVRHARSLSLEQHLVAHSENRQYDNREENDSQPSDPMRETAPEKHSMRKRFNIVEHRSSCCRESGHRFKKGIDNRRNAPADIKGKHAEGGEKQPRKSDYTIAVPASYNILRIPPPQNQQPSYSRIQQC